MYEFNPSTGESKTYHPNGLKGQQNNIGNIIWLHTSELLLLFDDSLFFFNLRTKIFTPFRYPLPFPVRGNIYSIYEDIRKNIWIGSNDNGAYVINRERNTTKYYPIDSTDQHKFPDRGAGMEYEDREGRLWFATATGFCYFDPVTEKFIKPKFPADFPEGQDMFREVCPDRKGNVWIADYKKCLIRYHVSDDSFRYYDLDNGLPDLSLRQMCFDANDHLWIMAKNIIYRFDPEKEKYYSFSESDGIYAGSQIKSISVSNDNNLYITFNNDRICMVKINDLLPNTYQPPVMINNVKVFDKNFPFTGNTIKLNHNDNYFSFEFSALNYTHPEKNQFAYSLEGFDKGWINSGNRNFASYTDIPPGNYTFKVKASNNDGVWNEKGASLNVIIVPAFWQTWWFKCLAALVVAVAGVGLARSNTKRKLLAQKNEFEKQQRVLEERERIASELHDDLGSGLTKISLMSQVAGTIAGDKQQQTLNKISTESSDMVDKMNGIIWALNTKNDTLPNLISFMRKHAFEMFEDSQIKLTWDAPEAIEEIPVSGEARRNIYLLVKEALHNALKYSLSDSVKVKVKVKEDALEIIIEDNGKGFDVALMNGKGNGLANMKKRIDDMKGDFKITSEIDNGTRINLEIKLN